MTFVACAGRSSIGLLAGRSPAVGVFGVCDLAASARYGQPLHVRVPYTHPHAAMTFAGLTLLAIVPPPGEPLRTYSRSVQAGSRLSDMAAATISRQQAHDPGGAGGASSFSQQPAQASTTNQQQQQPHNQQQQVQQQQQQSQQPTGFVNHGEGKRLQQQATRSALLCFSACTMGAQHNQPPPCITQAY